MINFYLDPISSTSLAPSMPMTRVIASKSSLNAFGEQVLSRKIDEATSDGLISYNMSKAHHMAETFKDIHAALVAKNNKKIMVIIFILKSSLKPYIDNAKTKGRK